MPLLDIVKVQEILPHRYPLLLVDGVDAVDTEAGTLDAYRCVSISDPILQGHFPGNPVVPGVLLIESMAQSAVILGSLCGFYDPDKHHCFFMNIEKARFIAPVVPGDRIDIHVKALRLGRIGRFAGEIRCNDQLRCTATITAGFVPKEKMNNASAKTEAKTED
ncbi:MAG: 3-hydroxyacyl-ACP dehydratase FabZ [Nannocystaceae bacterium]